MANVYSDVFLRNFTTEDLSTDPVPPGFVWIIRDIDVTSNASDTSALLIVIGTVSLYYLAGGTGPDPPNFAWRGRQVLKEGEYVDFQPLGATATWHINVSGYVLTLP
jgi:hypothetical protein